MIKYVITLILFFFFSGLFFAKYAKAQQINIAQTQANIITCTNDLKEFGFEPSGCKATCGIPNDRTKKDCTNTFYADYRDNKECLRNHKAICMAACGCIMWGNVALGLVPLTTQMFRDELAEVTAELAERNKK